MLFALGEWVEEALCRVKGVQADIWFDDANSARRICSACPVNNECLATAMSIQRKGIRVEGIWGGLSAIQISRLMANPSDAAIKRMRSVKRKTRTRSVEVEAEVEPACAS